MHNSKQCFKCLAVKPLSDFYKHSQMADGRLNKCKECCKKEASINRLEKIDYYLEYDKGRANLPHRIAQRKIYSKTEDGKIAANKAKKKWSESNSIKKAASILVNNRIKSGAIVKPKNCEACNASGIRIHGHHDDYSRPLEVRWLCSKCHCKWHKENGEGLTF